jgi:hypothetical protein
LDAPAATSRVTSLTDLERILAELSPKQLAEIDELLAPELSAPWIPNPGPQTQAYESNADILLYGGAAGGGKTDLLLGLALTKHQRTVVFRRAYVDLRGVEERLVDIAGRDGYNGQDMVMRRKNMLIECGALDKPGAEKGWTGRAHDLICFDEAGQLDKAKVAFVMGWLRSTDPDQHSRIVFASNPPIGGEGDWLVEWFAPWLDPMYPSPAMPGELRWAIRPDSDVVWVDGPGRYEHKGQSYTAQSRTFIPALLADNPYLNDTNYRATLENMPEPLRSQLLYGDFMAGREDHEWQVIPSEWVKLAQERWKNAPAKRRRMLAVAADPAKGGPDKVAVAALHEENWFAPIVTKKAAEIEDIAEVATMMVVVQKNDADMSVDGTGGWGSGVVSALKREHNIACTSLVFSAGSAKKSKDGRLGYANLRAEMYWAFREALDPESGEDIMLPPDPRMVAGLCAVRYKVRGINILLEEKGQVKDRVGSSPDEADSVVMAWHRRGEWVKKAIRQARPKEEPERVSDSSGGWMAS